MTWHDRPILAGEHVRLEPLSTDHAEGLLEAGKDPDIWTWLSERQPTSVAEMRAVVERALAVPRRAAWAQVDPHTGEVAGTTSYYEIDEHNRSLAVGYTWIGSRWHRTGVNTEAKLMLLTRAFEDLGAVRVVWHTHLSNLRSQRAIERLGATKEGVLRKHKRFHDAFRDTVQYSMLDTEWPQVRERLTTQR
ncbi:GNAT family protein [Kutzneria viridogrisea]|uniref:GCN5-related N-acetyltransferase n=2 Tax=Kutzneria TaxID=43356 RepID=W5VYR4_9PSEU|nr:GNAT family protein [Kutzneria albida]AHH93692.1 GCN5-related N-acetyltransferase [Kutzneria albida DSM 43870]MBA8931304.1 RimJ/RimL family protein N-acetyltransferase [Kutzneria viridogrisea]